MNKSAIQKFAIWARRELISRVSQKAFSYGVREDGIDAESISIDGRLLSNVEINERRALVTEINSKGYQQVMEEVAYTWFNRFCALRFMEVNGYLPCRVFSDEDNAFKPQIMTEAVHLDMDGLDMAKVYAYLEADQKDELYKYLLIAQCNALNAQLPGMFQKINDHTELLFPDNLLREGSVIEQMVAMIPEEDWKDAIQIVGWLYQYYNSEPKDKVFADLKKNIKISKNNIPAATQLFTPDWIVRYMVENSLGRLWLEGHPNEELRAGWKYYLDEAEQEPEVQAQLEEIRAEYRKLEPQDIKVIDPCMGSGHILAYMFDVLMQIYLDYGYTARDAVRSILENNLYGLDIDDRAGQLAYFAVMMKAQSYDRSFLRRTDNPTPHVFAIQENNNIRRRHLDFMGGSMDDFSKNNAKNQLKGLLDTLTDAKEYGSILNVETCDWDLLRRFATDTQFEADQYSFETNGIEQTSDALLQLISIGETLAQKHHVVVTNPPYMGSSGMGTKLSEFVKKTYPDSKSDLFAVFIERCGRMTKKNGYQAMITQHAWMFLSSYEKLRKKLLHIDTVNMVHLGPRAFEEIGGEVVQTSSFVFRKSHMDYTGIYCRLTEPTTQQGKEDMFLAGKGRYVSTQTNFSKIPGSPIAYWLSNNFIKLLEQEKTIGDVHEAGSGLSTADNDRFLRFFWEVDLSKIAECKEEQKKWYLFHKGGEYRKWYGNLFYVVNWENDGAEIKYWVTHNPKDPKTTSWSRRIFNTHLYFELGITWSVISSSDISFRTIDTNAMISNAAGGIFGFNNEEDRNNFMAAINSKVWTNIFATINPTLNYSSGVIQKAPVPQIVETKLGAECVSISKADWDSFETSWDFIVHPLVLASYVPDLEGGHRATLQETFTKWERLCEKRFNQLKSNEEELNRIYIDFYGLQNELTPEIEDKDVTVRKADLGRDIRSLISYAVGCMFGRYSLDTEGLAYAGGDFDSIFRKDRLIDQGGHAITFGGIAISVGKEYKYVKHNEEWVKLSFPPDTDNVIPICDDDYMDDDITARFVKWVETVYGSDTLEENLKFIADALGGKGTPREVIRNYFINDFYADHLKVYQKRPIYWLFDSGKKNGFKALIYMHRYQEDLLARIRTDYVHEMQERYRTMISQSERALVTAAGSSRAALNRTLDKLRAQLDEISVYEEKIAHLADKRISIDLDDGVKHNYALFQDVLAKIK